jgi:hypothetical protein
MERYGQRVGCVYRDRARRLVGGAARSACLEMAARKMDAHERCTMTNLHSRLFADLADGSVVVVRMYLCP